MQIFFDEAEKIKEKAKVIVKEANALEERAVTMIIAHWGFANVKIREKETKEEGFIKVERDQEVLRINFYPVKKNGKTSQRRNIYLSETVFTPSEAKIEKYLNQFEVV